MAVRRGKLFEYISRLSAFSQVRDGLHRRQVSAERRIVCTSGIRDGMRMRVVARVMRKNVGNFVCQRRQMKCKLLS